MPSLWLGFVVVGILASSPFCAANCTFYKFRIGDFNATILSDGSTAWDSSTLFPGTPFQAVEEAFRANFLPTDAIQFYYNVLHVDTGDKQILFDCGSGVNFGDATGKLLESMQAAGLDPNDVDDIILSHGHVDHLGGIVKPDGSFTFANAKYHISRQEQEYWRDVTLDDFPPEFTPDLTEVLLRVGKDTLESVAEGLVLFDLGDEVLPGVQSRGATGHTPGHSAFIIKSGDDSLMFVGDVLVFDLFSIERPEWRMLFDNNRDAAVGSRFSLLNELADSRMQFLSYHSDFPGLGHISRNRHGYSNRPSRYQFHQT
ncbi:hypothetical protein BSKO_04626 [Bryopsis sp. KO-2023]|nr:hypothetical protein BSKO_04626 [Bryopsis sp. KO-2023]